MPGKLLTRASDKEIAHECLTKARGNARTAMAAFIDRVKKGMSKKALESGSADTTAERRWYAVKEPHGRSHAPAAKIISAFNIKRRDSTQNSSL